MEIIKNKKKIITATTTSLAATTASSSSSTTTSTLCLCNNNNNIVGKQKCNMLLMLASNSNNDNSNNIHNTNNNNISNYKSSSLKSMTYTCGCISSRCCCHSTTKTITDMTTSATETPATTSTNTIITSSSSTSSLSSSTKDNFNYMHCENTLKMYTCHSSKIINNNSKKNTGNSIRSNSFKNCISNINNNLNSLIKFVIVLIFFTCCDLSQATLRDVNLYIEPPAVRRSQSVTLRCHYTLEGAPLYSVKFYRGQLEFFRYTPGEYPNTKVFHYPGIKVDESVSNATQVVIRNVNFGLSGNFSCEVTADAPLFSTATAYAQMQVVEFPDKRPQLFTELTRYEPGDVLRANCSTPPSRPRAELRFTINNIPVSSEEIQYIRTVDNLIASRLSLKVQLQAVHFAAGGSGGGNGGGGVGVVNGNSQMINALSGGTGGSGVSSYGSSYGGGGSTASGGALLLRCTAQIGDLYQEYKEIELGTPLKDPVPARVTSSGGGFGGFFETYFGSNSGASAFKTNSTAQTALIATSLLTLFIRLFQRR